MRENIINDSVDSFKAAASALFHQYYLCLALKIVLTLNLAKCNPVYKCYNFQQAQGDHSSHKSRGSCMINDAFLQNRCCIYLKRM